VGGFVDGSVCENEQNFGVAAQHPAKIDARLGSLVGVDHLWSALFWSPSKICEALWWSICIETHFS
jgi:hypothetical protein